MDLAEHGAASVIQVLSQVLGFQPSASAARRIAKQNDLRLVTGARRTVGGLSC